MPISQIDYETARADALDLASVHAAAQALVEATTTSFVQPQIIQQPEVTPEAVSPPPTAPDSPQEKESAPVESIPEAPPVEQGQAEQIQSIPAPRAEQERPSFVPEQPGVEDGFKNRIDAARGRINDRTQDTGELLDQAVTLLETLAQHPALEEYASIKQRLDTVEQMLNSSANVR